MYFIYSDEAGTSQNEEVTIVVGIVVHDSLWPAAAARLSDVLDEHVPEVLRHRFISHGKQLFNGYREKSHPWAKADRVNLLGAVAAIPRELGLAISLGMVRRTFPTEGLVKPSKAAELRHLVAVHSAIARGNKYVRDWGKPNEVVVVVAEDMPDKKKLIKRCLDVRIPTMSVDAMHVIPTMTERATGVITQTFAPAIDRVVDTVHFAAKNEAPLLQIADACAFSFRRYFSDQDLGDQLIQSMLGCELNKDDYSGPMSEMVFSFNPNHAYPRRIRD